MKFFEDRRVKGAISIFLVIITIPTMLFAAVLVDGSRMASAKAITQEAADLAAASVLADYNLDLKENYGLFALDDSSKVESIYQESLKATLLASGFSESEKYSERLWEILKSTAGTGNPYEEKSFLNLYDFSVDSCSVTPMYSLAEWQVLENQMVEYAKFRGIFVMADRLDLLQNLGEAKAQQEKNKETAQSMEQKMDVDEKNASADKALETLRTSISSLNDAIDAVESCRDNYYGTLKAKMKEIRLSSIETDETLTSDEQTKSGQYTTSRNDLETSLDLLDQRASDVLDKASKAMTEVDKAINNLNAFITDNQGKSGSNEDIASLIEEAQNNVTQYETVYKVQINSILKDSVIKQLENDFGIPTRAAEIMEQIDVAINRYALELQEEEEAEEETEEKETEEGETEEEETEEEETYYYYYLDGRDRTEDESLILSGLGSSHSYQDAVDGQLAYFINEEWTPINPGETVSGGKSSNIIDEEDAKSLSGKTEEGSDDSSEERKEVPEEIYNARPSKTFVSEAGKSSNNNFYNEAGDLSSAKEMISQGKEDSMIQRIGETARDDVLCLSYMFGTFKTRLSGVEKFSASGMSQSDKNSFYMPDWRYSHENGEIDMRFSTKKDRETVLRSEIEYLIFGNRTDAANENAVYATIFAERLANNMIAVYGVNEIRQICHAAAAAASALTGFVVPEAVFFWIFIAAWATAETIVDMNFLIEGGYRIPILKTKNNVILKEFPGDNGLISNYGESGIFVSYEDYLLILLLLAGRETRLMRSADLIEMNMKKTQSDFTMAEAYTYLHGKTEFSTRYLFGSVMPFQTEYERGGATGRMEFTNEIYLGY